MAQSIDVGTVLGGRYKVTSSIVTSHESDLVLGGVDQVLNRPVSILVAGPSNADQLAQSAREVAMGERHGAVQVLDLGISHGSTYLITNHTSPADLLDLIVPQETPYVEPFFTDTLGSEIFGESRSREPETYDGMVDPGRPDQYIRYDDYGQPEHHEGDTARGGAAGAAAAGGAAGAGAAAAARQQHQQSEPGGLRPAQGSPAQGSPAQGRSAQPQPRTAQGGAGASGAVPPPPQAPPRPAGNPSSSADTSTQSFGAAAPGAAAAAGAAANAGAEPASETASPKVTPWSSAGNRDSSGDVPTAASPQQRPAAQPQQRQPEPSAGAAPFLPAAVRPSSPANEDVDYEDDESTRPRSMPWLVGGVLAVVLIAALIFAFTTLGGLFQPQGGTANSTSQPSQKPTDSQEPSASASAEPTAPAAPPAIDSVTRLNPQDLSFADSFDSRLPLTFDGNTATYWSDMEFAREDWGGFTKSVALSVKLTNPAQVKQVTLIQSGGSGGNLSIYTNSQPSLSGATLAGTTSFTGPQVSVPVSGTPTAQYVIIQINALPRLSAPKTQYPFGLRLAEIKVE
ncbi:ABC transporter substrate-binding protein [Micrococcus luteus]